MDTDNKQLGVVDIQSALRAAEEKELDLVEIAPQAVPPVCKIIDYGKFLYEIQKKDKLQKKNQTVVLLKEIRLHPNTDQHDFDFKLRHAERFLDEGHKVKVAVIFKGRELAYKEQGETLLIRFNERLEEVSKLEQEPKFEGRTMSIVLAPSKTKKKK